MNNDKTQIENTQSDKGESEFLGVISGMRHEKVFEALGKFMTMLKKQCPELHEKAMQMLKE